jgi:hypothetical protein
MKHPIFGILIILTFALQINAQTNDSIPSWRQAQINKIVDLIKNDNFSQLSEVIRFPIKRPNPVPDIENKESFLRYCPTLFDDNFKQKLINAKFTPDNTISRDDDFGLLYGYIWLNKNGEIIALNYNSDKELLTQKKLTDETRSLIHPSVKNWKKNMMVCKSDKFIIRIDLMDDLTLRYASWSIPKSISDKPDLVLFNGTEEFHGTRGGVTYTFQNSKWKYVIDRVDICEKGEDCGLFFKLLISDQEKRKTRMEGIK